MSEKKILVVDDDQEVTTLLVELLGNCGYVVICACNGAEALALLTENPTVDLVLTDLDMPYINGVRLAEILEDLYPFIAVLLMTGGSNKGLTAPPHLVVVQKPFSVNHLKDAVKQALTAP